jgi:DNA-binding MarR family transcriptional regulator
MTRALSDREREVWMTFRHMRRQLDVTLERRLHADAGISTADFEILLALHDEPGHRLRAGRIADAIDWEKSRVSHQLTRMESRGLVAREECDDDARGIWLTITPEGTAAVVHAIEDRTEVVREYFLDLLDESEQAQLLEISHRVLGAIAPPICDEVSDTVDA